MPFIGSKRKLHSVIILKIQNNDTFTADISTYFPKQAHLD